MEYELEIRNDEAPRLVDALGSPFIQDFKARAPAVRPLLRLGCLRHFLLDSADDALSLLRTPQIPSMGQRYEEAGLLGHTRPLLTMLTFILQRSQDPASVITFRGVYSCSEACKIEMCEIIVR
jgi:hypothetical protein